MEQRLTRDASAQQDSELLACRVVLVLAAIHVFLAWNALWGPVRLDGGEANAIVGFFGVLLAWTPFAVALRIRPTALKVGFAILALGWALLYVIFYVPVVGTSFEIIDTFNSHNHRLVAYRTDGGAATQPGIVVREERPLVGGLKLVHVVASEYAADDADLSSAGNEAVRIRIHHYGDDSEQTTRPDIRIVPLRSLWF